MNILAMVQKGVTLHYITLKAVSHVSICHEWSSVDHVIAVWVCTLGIAIDRLWSIH